MQFDFDAMYYGAVKRGDIFLSLIENKKQLVVVLQDTVLNERLGTVAVIPIEPYKGGKVFKNETLLKVDDTGLDKDGLCSLFKLLPISRTALLAKKGEVQQEKLTELYQALDINLGRFRD